MRWAWMNNTLFPVQNKCIVYLDGQPDVIRHRRTPGRLRLPQVVVAVQAVLLVLEVGRGSELRVPGGEVWGGGWGVGCGGGGVVRDDER
jgi:hypothetical protein